MKQWLILFLLFAMVGCKKDEAVDNPYDLPQNKAPESEEDTYSPDPNSIAGLHKNIFQPTCANSGCHDGTFEPDFRTIQSTYNTLVLQPVIKNNPQGTFDYRVVPGDPDAGVLITRLMTDIDGQSGIMPLVVEPGSDWDAKRNEYIQNVRNWIQNGAKDLYGNSPGTSNLAPQLNGIFITVSGSSVPLERNVSTGALVVPTGTSNIDVYVSISDDNTPVNQLGVLKLKTGATLNNFSALPELSLTAIAGVSQIGYSGSQVSYQHKIILPVSGLTLYQKQFIRVYVQDDQPVVTEIPSVNSAEHIRNYYSFQVGEQ